MTIIDMKGNILRTHCSYDKNKGLIKISPIDSYEENKYYILTISSEIYSYSGKRLKSPINIMFKLKA